MKSIFNQVAEFNEKVLNIKPLEKGNLLASDVIALSCHQLHEEADELQEAHDEQDYIGAVDACIDSIYFSLGILYKLGVKEHQFDAIFEVVNNANMAKVSGKAKGREKHSAADATKPEGWSGPEDTIAQILADD